MSRHSAATAPLDPRGKTLPQLLVERAQMDPDRVAYRQKHHGIWRSFTWGEVLRQVRDLADGLRHLGLRSGETSAVIGENEPEHFWAEYAAQCCGAASISLYPDLTADEMQYILEHSGASILFVQDQEQTDKALAIIERLPNLRHVIYWDPKGMWSYAHPQLLAYAAVDEAGRTYHETNPNAFDAAVAAGKSSDTAVLLYTSGTTSRPKGVVCAHSTLIDTALRLVRAAPIRPGGEHLSYIAPAWAIEQQVGFALAVFWPLVVNFPERPETVLQDLRELAVDMVVFTPRQWESLASDIGGRMLDAGPIRRWVYRIGLAAGAARAEAEAEGRSLSWKQRMLWLLAEIAVLQPLRDKLGLTRVAVAICGGAAMAPDIFRLFHAMGVRLRNGYGSTEFGMIAIHQGSAFDLETVGDLMPVDPDFGEPIRLRLTDEGELLLQGGGGFLGYFNDPAKTAEKWLGEWFRTGDHCVLKENGQLVFLERMEDLRTLSGGHRYPPQYIETRLRFSPFIKDAMTVGDERHGWVGALIGIDGEVVTRWAEERGITFSTYADLSQRPEVCALVQAEIARVNRLLVPAAQVCRFANLPKPLDPDEGELTRTRKLRRLLLEEKYASLIGDLYGSDDATELRIAVRYQDGRRGELRAQVRLNTVKEPPALPAPPAALLAQRNTA